MPQYVSDLLRRVPGLYVGDPNGSPVGTPATVVNPRGHSARGPRRVGRVRRRARSSDTDINVVDPALVEAVEIYRGSPGPI